MHVRSYWSMLRTPSRRPSSTAFEGSMMPLLKISRSTSSFFSCTNNQVHCFSRNGSYDWLGGHWWDPSEALWCSSPPIPCFQAVFLQKDWVWPCFLRRRHIPAWRCDAELGENTIVYSSCSQHRQSLRRDLGDNLFTCIAFDPCGEDEIGAA